MSAYVVSRSEIRFLVEAAFRMPERHQCLSWFWNVNRREYTMDRAQLKPADYREAARVGQMLWDENIRSVLHRYPQDTRETMPGPIGEDFAYDRHENPHSENFAPERVIRVIHRLDYQSCEHPEWPESEAYAFLQALERAAVNRVLDGYEEAHGDGCWDVRENPETAVSIFAL